MAAADGRDMQPQRVRRLEHCSDSILDRLTDLEFYNCLTFLRRCSVAALQRCSATFFPFIKAFQAFHRFTVSLKRFSLFHRLGVLSSFFIQGHHSFLEQSVDPRTYSAFIYLSFFAFLTSFFPREFIRHLIQD